MAKIHTGPPLSLDNETIHDYLFKRMETFGNRTCLIDKATNEKYTFTEVVHMAKSIATGLFNLGVVKGDIIVFLKHTSASIVMMLLGSLAAGTQVCFINPASTSYELKQYLIELGSLPKFIFTDVHMVAKLQPILNHNEARLIIGAKQPLPGQVTLQSLLQASHTTMLQSGPQYDPRATPALILYSSGTTGKPKPLVLSHTNLLAATKMYGTMLGTAGVSLVTFPLYHIAGIKLTCLVNPANGVTSVFYPHFDFKEFLQGIEFYKPESIQVPTSVVVLMTKSPLVKQYNLSSLRKVTTGASTTKPEVEDAFRKLLPSVFIGQVYGLSEASGGCIAFPKNPDLSKQASVGKVLPGIKVKVMDSLSGEILGPNKSGEIWIRGPIIMMGYLNNPEATHQTIDENGWLHSGDLGYYDEDDYFFIVGRIKELVKYKGFQVAPAELDAILLDHPDIIDAAVTGKPDLEAGELPCAFVVRRPGSNITEKQVMDFVKDRVSYYKYLRGGVYFVDAIPRLQTGKILRLKLKEMLNTKANL